MKKHLEDIEGYEGKLEDLAIQIGNLKYNRTNDFILSLANEIKRQAEADEKRGRKKLSERLYKTAESLYQAYREMDLAWKICEPYMKEKDKF